MSREDLNQIQFKLKSAIQNHQVLVGKLKKDPKNTDIQQQLHTTQAELTSLNERQKQIVIQLRKQVSLNKPVGPDKSKPAHKPKLPSHHAQQSSVIKENANSNLNRSSSNVKTVTSPSHEPQISPRQSAQRPSIMQVGNQRGCVLRIHNDVPVCPVKTPTETKDLRGILRSAIEAKDLSPEEKQKIEYMASLNLITRDRLKSIQTRRSERKRRSTATPQFSYVHGHLPPEKKRSHNSVVDEPPLDRRRGQGQRSTSSSRLQTTASTLARDEESCAVCRRTGQLFSCDTCNRLYHHTCLSMATRPPVNWSCPKCQPASGKQTENHSQDVLLVESYLHQKKMKEKVKKNLEELKKDLSSKKSQLEDQAKQLSAAITHQVQEKSELLQEKQEAEDQLNKLKDLVKSLQT